MFQRARIIIVTTTGNVSASNILREALCAAKDLKIREILLALGPTSPTSLDVRNQKVIWATFLDAHDVRSVNGPVVITPTRLTDLSINFEKMSKRSTVRLLLGDFLDSTLSASSEPAVYSFLSRLLARVRESKQTAFFLVTEDMHDVKKIAMVKRFADIVIEYRGVRSDVEFGIEKRILDYTQGCYGDWSRTGKSEIEYEDRLLLPRWNDDLEPQT